MALNLLEALSQIVEKKDNKKEPDDLLKVVQLLAKLEAKEKKDSGGNVQNSNIDMRQFLEPGNQNMEIPNPFPPATNMGQPQGPPRPPEVQDYLRSFLRGFSLDHLLDERR